MKRSSYNTHNRIEASIVCHRCQATDTDSFICINCDENALKDCQECGAISDTYCEDCLTSKCIRCIIGDEEPSRLFQNLCKDHQLPLQALLLDDKELIDLQALLNTNVLAAVVELNPSLRSIKVKLEDYFKPKEEIETEVVSNG